MVRAVSRSEGVEQDAHFAGNLVRALRLMRNRRVEKELWEELAERGLAPIGHFTKPGIKLAEPPMRRGAKPQMPSKQRAALRKGAPLASACASRRARAAASRRNPQSPPPRGSAAPSLRHRRPIRRCP